MQQLDIYHPTERYCTVNGPAHYRPNEDTADVSPLRIRQEPLKETEQGDGTVPSTC